MPTSPFDQLPNELLDEILEILVSQSSCLNPGITPCAAFTSGNLEYLGITALMSNKYLQDRLTKFILKTHSLRFSRASAFTRFFTSLRDLGKLRGSDLLSHVSSLRFETEGLGRSQVANLLKIVKRLSQKETCFIFRSKDNFVFPNLENLEIHFETKFRTYWDGEGKLLYADDNEKSALPFDIISRLITLRIQNVSVTGLRDIHATFILEEVMMGRGTDGLFELWVLAGYEIGIKSRYYWLSLIYGGPAKWGASSER